LPKGLFYTSIKPLWDCGKGFFANRTDPLRQQFGYQQLIRLYPLSVWYGFIQPQTKMEADIEMPASTI